MIAVLGAGQMGVAIAATLQGMGHEVVICDASAEATWKAAENIGCCGLEWRIEDGIDPWWDAVVCALPYKYNFRVAAACVAAGVHYSDLGGNDAMTRRVLALDARAREMGVSLVPDSGLAPGMLNIVARWAWEQVMDGGAWARVKTFCGGLPQRRERGYQLCFSTEGLANEYRGPAWEIRNGQAVEQPTVWRRSTVLVKGERFWGRPTSGGGSTIPFGSWTGLDSFSYDTLRGPGTWGQVEAMEQLGLLENTAKARKAFRYAAEAIWGPADEPDRVVAQVHVTGSDGAVRQWSLVDMHDGSLTAMQRCTGFSAAIVAEMQVRGNVGAGARAAWAAVNPSEFVRSLKERGIVWMEDGNL